MGCRATRFRSSAVKSRGAVDEDVTYPEASDVDEVVLRSNRSSGPDTARAERPTSRPRRFAARMTARQALVLLGAAAPPWN